MPSTPHAPGYLFGPIDPREAFLAGSIAPFFGAIRGVLEEAICDTGWPPPVVFVEVGPGCAPPEILAGAPELIERQTGYSLDPPPEPSGNLYVVGPGGGAIGFVAGYVSWARAQRAASVALGAAAAQLQQREIEHGCNAGRDG